jgi:hypothetical protein
MQTRRIIAALSISVMLFVTLYELIDIHKILVANSNFVTDASYVIIFNIREEKESCASVTTSSKVKFSNQLLSDLTSVEL